MKRITITLMMICSSFWAFAQIGIGTTTPDASSILDMTSTSQGVLIPRMTSTQRDAISSPAVGLQVYDTTTNSVWIYNGAAWINGTGGPGKFVEGGASDIAYYADRVGIGLDNFSTAHKLFVEGVKTTDGPNTASRTRARYEGSGTNVSTYGATHNSENNSTGTVGFAIGSYNSVDNIAGAMSTGYGTYSEVTNNGGNLGFGAASSVNITNNSTMDFAVGQFLTYAGTGTTDSSYAIFINASFDAGQTNNFSIYSQTTADSYFAGNIGVGLEAPQRQIHVSEAMRLEPQATAPSNGALGDLYVGTDGNLYFHNGVDWQQVQLVP